MKPINLLSSRLLSCAVLQLQITIGQVQGTNGNEGNKLYKTAESYANNRLEKGLQSALNASEVLLSRPVSTRPNVLHRFPYVPARLVSQS